MKVSIIIPVYNVEDYLERCIHSIIEQSYSHLEIILVNDGSTDRSGVICDQFQKCDPRVRVIHQDNGGVSSARNAGIRESTGDYITFVDSDDWLEREMYKSMVAVIQDGQEPEVIMCDFVTVKNNSKIKITSDLFKGFYSKKDIIRDVYPKLLVTEDFGRIAIVSAWNCLFKKAFLLKNNIGFDVRLRYSEDCLFMAQVMVNCTSYFYLKGHCFYNYRQYGESRSKKYQPEWWSNLVSLNNKLRIFLSDNQEYDFSRQLKLQLIHSALFVSSSLYQSDEVPKRQKLSTLKKVFNHADLKAAFNDLLFDKQSVPLKAVLYLMKFRMAGSYLIYRSIISALK